MDVTIRCLCPHNGTEVRHPDGDKVELRDRLDFLSATAIRKSMGFAESDDESGRAAEIYARLTESYILFGIVSWSLVDVRGKPVPVSHSAIRSRILEDMDTANLVAEAADDLYKEAILLPLLKRASTSSSDSPTNGSTSPPTDSRKRRPTPLKRSSTSTTPTDDTVTTSSSPGGASSFSQNSESAA